MPSPANFIDANRPRGLTRDSACSSSCCGNGWDRPCPWLRNISRSLLQAPKVYFTDTGLVKGDGGVRFENAVAVMLRKQVHHLVDTRGCDAGLHYIRTKDGAEVDFSLSLEGSLSHLVECKLADSSPHRALSRFALQFPEAEAVQLVRDARQQEQRGAVAVMPAGEWLAHLPV